MDLSITAGNTTMRGLVINRFTGAGISISTGGWHTVIEGNYIGTNAGGHAGECQTAAAAYSSTGSSCGNRDRRRSPLRSET